MQSAIAQRTIGTAGQAPQAAPIRIGTAPGPSSDPRSARILAKSIYRELRSGGVHHEDMIALATELLGLVADEMKSER